MKHQIVIGHLFGDEGKGTVVNWLCSKAKSKNLKPIVYVSSGGSQNAHTIKYNGIKHIFSSFGSGTLQNVPTVLDKNYMLDPICAMNEYKVLVAEGIVPKFFIHPLCRIITPYDVEANRSDSANLADGSCGKGIFKTFKRNKDKRTLHWYTCVDESEPLEVYLENIAAYYKTEVDENFNKLFREAVEFIKKKSDTYNYKKFEKYDVGIHECSQGLLLDMDYGIDWPHLTPSWTGLMNFDEDILKNAEVYLVARTYLTRHGKSGIKPDISGCKQILVSDPEETNVFNDYQGNFKKGLLDTNLMNRAWDRHNLDMYIRKYNTKFNLCFSHLDTFVKDEKDGLYKFTAFLNGSRQEYMVENEEELCKYITKHLCYQPNNIFWSRTSDGKYNQILK